MGNLLGRTKSPKKVPSRVTEQDRIVLQMKQQRDKLKQHQRQLETRLEKERQVASRLVKEGKKERALIILKKKKYMEKIIEKTENHLEKIERLTRDVEWAQIEVNVVRNLEQGNEALKSLTALINLDDIEKMLDETRDAAEVQREISDLIIGVAPEIEVDDDALLSELDELIKVEQPAVEPSAPAKIFELPEVPAGDIEHEPSEIILQRDKNKSQKELEMVPA